jgi:phosphate transport system substrate-binding protein
MGGIEMKKISFGQFTTAFFVLLIFGFFLLPVLFMVLLNGTTYYIPLILVITLGLYSFLLLFIFNISLNKKGKKIYTGILLAAVLLASIQPIYEWIDNQIATVNAEVDIYQYMPFVEGNQVIELSEPATLKLQEPLPKMDGATALYPLYSAIAQAVYPENNYNPYESAVMVNQTPEAYSNLINKKVDLIFAAGPSDQQINLAKTRGIELKLIPIGKEAFVFFVNSNNEVDNLTLQQIKDIYSGKITNWSELGGGNAKIRAFQRPQDSGSQTALQRLMGDIPIMEAPSEDVATGMGGIIHEVSQYKNYKNAIGYTFRYYSNEMVRNKEIKLLAIDGVVPTKETIRENSYPITSQFYIVTRDDVDGNVQTLIDWVLSEQGQELIEQAGYVSIISSD